MFKKVNITLSMSTGRLSPEWRYWLHVETQPMHRWLISKVYRVLDRVFYFFYRFTWFKYLENRQIDQHRDNEFYIPLSNRWDLYEDRIRHKGVVIVATFEIDKEKYQRLEAVLY
jgi:hypothetical protein